MDYITPTNPLLLVVAVFFLAEHIAPGRGLHQVHHSASRIEILTSFYKHPLEMAANSIIISVVLFAVLGA
jgi:hypothetical protein